MPIQIYIIVPNQESVTNWFHTVLIWSDSEDNARQNAESITPGQEGRDRSPLAENDLTIFQDPTRSSCRALDLSEYEIIQYDNDSVQIRYDGNVYNLNENESVII
ncbi:hypothetical protein SC979_09270 [Legionella pneumophila serogroup 1]